MLYPATGRSCSQQSTPQSLQLLPGDLRRKKKDWHLLSHLMDENGNQLHGFGNSRLHDKIGEDGVSRIQAQEDDFFHLPTAVVQGPVRHDCLWFSSMSRGVFTQRPMQRMAAGRYIGCCGSIRSKCNATDFRVVKGSSIGWRGQPPSWFCQNDQGKQSSEFGSCFWKFTRSVNPWNPNVSRLCACLRAKTFSRIPMGVCEFVARVRKNDKAPFCRTVGGTWILRWNGFGSKTTGQGRPSWGKR